MSVAEALQLAEIFFRTSSVYKHSSDNKEAVLAVSSRLILYNSSL